MQALAAPGAHTASCTHLVPSLAVKLQPKILLLHEVEVAAGEVEEPFPTGFLLANKQHRSSRLGNADSSSNGISESWGEVSAPFLHPFPDHTAAKSYSKNAVGFSQQDNCMLCSLLLEIRFLPITSLPY